MLYDGINKTLSKSVPSLFLFIALLNRGIFSIPNLCSIFIIKIKQILMLTFKSYKSIPSPARHSVYGSSPKTSAQRGTRQWGSRSRPGMPTQQRQCHSGTHSRLGCRDTPLASPSHRISTLAMRYIQRLLWQTAETFYKTCKFLLWLFTLKIME